MSDRRVSHYRILDRLGQGGMGEVYVAEDETLRRKVALKSIRREHRLDPDLRARFLREARILSQLDHPNICRIFGFFSEEGSDYLVLELIEGVTLESVIAAGVERKRALAIALAIADALAAAHAAGVVHRDIKPGNVMVTSEGVTKVLDFGLSRVHPRGADGGEGAHEPLARAAPLGAPEVGLHGTLIWEDAAPADAAGSSAASAESLHTQRGGLLGTVRYMSPEQARGELVTAASDMYALGLVLQELFTGAPAHDPHATGPEVLERTRAAISAPVRGVGRGVERGLADLIERLKSSAPTRRPTADEVLRRLRWIQHGPQRRARRALVVVGLLAAVVGAAKYTLDLRYERGRAEGRTEAALDMMETLFREQVPVLAQVNRLDAFDATAEGVQAYFAAVPREELTDRELVKLSKLLMLVGSVRRDQGRAHDAQQSFREALTLAEELAQRRPRDSEVVLSLGAAHFYMGQTALMALDDPAAALESFRAYHAAALSNQALDPNPLNAARELVYARNAIAGALLALDRAPEALAEQESIVQFLRALCSDAARESELRVDLADMLSWLGSARLEAGDAALARDTFEEELVLRRKVLADDPRNAAARVSLSYVSSFLAKLHLAEGRHGDAIQSAREARDLLAELRANDPRNAELTQSLQIALRDCGDALVAADRAEDASEEYAASLALGEELVAQDSSRASARRTLAPLALDLARAQLAAGRFVEVAPTVRRAQELADADPDASVHARLSVHVQAQDLLGCALTARDEASAARAEWSRGLELLAATPESELGAKLRASKALLLARLGRLDEAAALVDRLPPDDRTVAEVLALLARR